MTLKVVIIGAGGFGREVLDIVHAVNASGLVPQFDVLGVVDDDPAGHNLARLEDRGVSYLGTTELFFASPHDAVYIVGVGSPGARAAIVERWTEAGYSAVSVVHPSANLGSNCALGDGSVVCSGAQISTNVRLGRHVHVNPNATVGHDAVLDDFVSVNPGAIVSGEVHMDSRSLVGAGAVILQGLTVGHDSVVGASACVVCDVLPGAIVKGVPAR